MRKELFDRYSAIQLQIKELEAEADTIKPDIMADMDAEEVESVNTDNGSFFYSERKTWTYPEPITQAEAQLKEQKKKAEMLGEAKFETKRIFSFRALKQEEQSAN